VVISDLLNSFLLLFQCIIIVLTLQVPSKRKISLFLIVLDRFYTLSKTSNLLVFSVFNTENQTLAQLLSPISRDN
jgi:hypothetical protein